MKKIPTVSGIVSKPANDEYRKNYDRIFGEQQEIKEKSIKKEWQNLLEGEFEVRQYVPLIDTLVLYKTDIDDISFFRM
jgi:hypothetical protein